jgi:hypothetical protein
MEVLAQVQMVTNNFGIRNFRHPMRRLNVHLGWGFFFLLGFGGCGWWDFFVFWYVPNVFSSSYQKGFATVPNRFSIEPQFYPILFGHISTSIYKL